MPIAKVVTALIRFMEIFDSYFCIFVTYCCFKHLDDLEQIAALLSLAITSNNTFIPLADTYRLTFVFLKTSLFHFLFIFCYIG